MKKQAHDTITYKGRKIILNRRLIIQKCVHDETLNEIIKCHKLLIDIDIKLQSTNDKPEINSLLIDWHGVQFILQELCGFKQDINYHEFWRLTACTCPKMDNEDRYPSGYYVYSGDCSLHGDFVK
jgi:hypothetical protein